MMKTGQCVSHMPPLSDLFLSGEVPAHTRRRESHTLSHFYFFLPIKVFQQRGSVNPTHCLVSILFMPPRAFPLTPMMRQCESHMLPLIAILFYTPEVSLPNKNYKAA